MRENLKTDASSGRMRGRADDAVPAPQEYLDAPGVTGPARAGVEPLPPLPSVAPDPPAGPDAPDATGPVDGDLTRAMLADLGGAPSAPTTRGGVAAYTLDDSVELGDIDNLFLWGREDAAGVQKFLGWLPKNALDLHGWFQRMAQIIGASKGALYAIRAGAQHAGFIMLLPIVQTPGSAPVGTVHIFVAPAYRGDFVNIVRGAMADADRLAPGVTLFIATANQEMARLFEQFGFESGFHLVRKAKG